MRLLLVRHAMCDPVGRALAGRLPGVTLNAEGRAQAEALARRLSHVPLNAVYSSPLERALETAAAIAREHDIEVRTEPLLNEIEFGDWTGRSFDELAPLDAWREWNEHRGTARVPLGESMVEARDRALECITQLRGRHAGETIVVVSHADIIKSLVVHWLGGSLDDLWRLDVEPASVTTVDVLPDHAIVHMPDEVGLKPT